jgi:POT family proton-dependent oligopeptide transporter
MNARSLSVLCALAGGGAALWVRLVRRQLDPSIPAKFVWALVLLALGFLVAAAGAHFATAGNKVLPTWPLEADAL